MAVFLDIQSALETKLNSIVNHPYIVWENDIKYTPTIGTRYWRATVLPLRSELSNANALQKHQGIFQVDVFVPAESGLAQLMGDLDTIYSEYNTVLSLYANDSRIDIKSIGRGKVLREKAWCMGYIEIYYECYSH